ncbi:MAG: hypothetical protein QME49_04800 [bacterium]|nr:hypothetical protein [bacterium]
MADKTADEIYGEYLGKIDDIWKEGKEDLQKLMKGKQVKKALGLAAGKAISSTEAGKMSKQQLRGIMADIGSGIKDLGKETVHHVEQLGWTAEQLAGMVERVGWQQRIVDDVTASVSDRLSHIFDVQYGSIADYDKHMDRLWGFEKEKVLDAFRDEIREQADKLIDEKISIAAWQETMKETIDKHHVSIFETARKEYGGEGDLSKEQLSWLHKEIAEEKKYLKGFRQDIDAGDLVNTSPDAIRARADLYAGKGNTLYQAGKNAAFEGQEVLIYWTLGIPMTDHCHDCPELADGSPYTPETLPTFPGSGDTACLTSCCCSLTYEFKNDDGESEFEGEIL